MSDLISREDVIEEYTVSFGLTIEDIERIPAVDAEPIKHGRWVLNRDGNWACSRCGFDPYHDNMKGMNYCPNCGARMDGE